MGDVTALMMDVITEKSGHSVTPMAVSVCITPAAPSPLPIPYPVMASSVEGITDAAMRTRVNGSPWATVGSVLKTCHGNEPGTLKEVVSLNTTGPVFITMGAPTIYAELGMAGITGSLCMSNKQVTVGSNGAASGAGGGGGGGGGAGGGGPGASGPSGPQGPSNGGGGGGGSNSGAGGSSSSADGRQAGAPPAAGSSSGPAGQHQCQNGHPVDLVTGHVVDTAVDLELGGRIEFSVKRTYSSARHRDRAATMGPGWAHGLEQSIAVEGGLITLRDQEARAIWFENVPVGGSSFHRRERLTLVRDGELDFRVIHHKGRVTSSFRPLSPGGAALLRSVEDAWGNRLDFSYEDGRLASVHDTAGRDLRVRWRGSRIVRLEVFAGTSCERWVDYAYDDAGMLSSVSDALGHAEHYEYDGYGRMSAATTKLGARFEYRYDPETGRCARTFGPKGLFALDIEYDTERGLTRVFGEESRLVEWADLPGYARREMLLDGTVLDEVARDSDGYVIARANGAGEGEKIWYDARGNEVRRVDAAGRATVSEYDADDNLVRTIDAAGNVTSYSYDDKGALLAAIHPNQKRTAATYDDRGRLVRIEEAHPDKPSAVLRLFEYDGAHNLIAETDSRGQRTTYATDALGRRVQETDALGRTTRVVRDRLGRPTLIRYADGATIQRTFDASGRVTREVDPNGGVVEMSWQGMGKLARLVDADGRSWRLAYTDAERLASITNPAGEVYAYRYDEAGRVIETKTFDGRTVGLERDRAGRVAKVTQPDGTTRSYEYDRTGKLLTDTASDGSRVTFRRDALGLVIEAHQEEPEGGRHVTHFERDKTGQILVERQGDRVIRYAYDVDGRVVERTLFDGSVTRWAFDGEGFLTGAAHQAPNTKGASYRFERDALGREVKRQDDRGAFFVEHGFDAVDQLISQRVTGAIDAAGVPQIIAERLYQHDRAGRVTQIDDGQWAKTSYRYDKSGRLEEALSGDVRRSYHYDVASSLVGVLEGLASKPAGKPGRWKVAAGNRLSETERFTYVYDKRARRVARRDKRAGAVVDYVWDVRDRLREVRLADGTRVRMSYDAFGRRVRKEVLSADGARPRVTELIWQADRLCADITPELGLRVFVHHPNGSAPLLQAERGEVLMVVTDHVGVPREMIDAAGRVAWAARHDPWGRILEERWDPIGEQNRGYRVRSPFRLLGQYFDEETGLAHTRHRFFDAEVGRWLSPDPLGVWGGLNLSGFDGAPTVEIDPLGLSADGGNPHNHPPYTNPDGSIRWPPDDGFASKAPNTLQPGHRIDRYGGRHNPDGSFSDTGTFVADAGTPYGARALPAGSDTRPYKTYEVVRPIETQTGPAAPWFGEPGGGTQHKLPGSIDSLVASGHLREVNS